MCPAATLARASLLLTLVVGSRQLSISEFVVPSTVRAGENAELACRLDRDNSTEELFVKWFTTPAQNNSDRTQIYQRITGQKGASMRHDIQVKDGEDDTIVLTEALPTDSGTYECEISSMANNNLEVRSKQQLTVFSPGTGPQLNVSEVADGPDDDTEEDVLIECRAGDVAPEPDMLLKINGEEFNMTENVTGPNGEGFYDVEGSATVSRAAADGATVSCELTFLDTSVAHELYVDTVDYRSSATTTELPEETTEPVVTQDSVSTQSGNRSAGVSWALLAAVSLLTQAPSILRLFHVILM